MHPLSPDVCYLLSHVHRILLFCHSKHAPLQEGIVHHLQLQGQESELLRSIYLQEVNRVKFLMRGYLRCRLWKVEKYVMYILDNEEEQEKLSSQELHHAQVNLAS